MKPRLEWTVQPGDGDSVAEVVDRMRRLGMPRGARVTLNGRMASLDEPVQHGDCVELWPQDDRHIDEQPCIVAQRDGVLLAYKPAGLMTETEVVGDESLVTALLRRLKGGHVKAASRLDVQVSGVVLCTIGRDAARRVQSWRAAGHIVKSYLAIVVGGVGDTESWTTPLGKLRDERGRARSSPQASAVLGAHTDVRTLSRASGVGARTYSLLELTPRTSRVHQIRAHCALAGAPVLGDTLYGGPRTFAEAGGEEHEMSRIALHCHRVELPGVVGVAPIPEQLKELWSKLGGDAGAWP